MSWGEFRLLNAYLCIYATMFDAFSKIDGGGEGTEGDDRRIDEEEWMKGYKEVRARVRCVPLCASFVGGLRPEHRSLGS